MPGSSVYVGGGGGEFTEAPAAAVGNTEIRFEPGTRLVDVAPVELASLPHAEDGMGASWYRTVTSRSSAAGVTTEIAELKCFVDLAGLVSSGADTWVIGVEDAPSDLGHLEAATYGTFLAATMLCLETPAGGEPDLNLITRNSGGQNEGTPASGDGTAIIVNRGGDWAAGDLRPIATGSVAAQDALYLTIGTGTDPVDNTYSAGKFLLTFICQYAVPS